MKIITWNTNGLRATYNQGNFFPLFEKYQPDILCLQETKAAVGQLPEEAKNVPGYYSFFASSVLKKGYSGVAIYTKEDPIKVELGIGIPEFDDEGRTIVAHFKNFVLINCYFPNGGGGPVRLDYKLRFYDAFLEYANKLRKEGRSVIFCGDVNTAHHEIDLARPKANENNTGFLPIEREWMDSLALNGYVDVFRHLYPNKADAYTYWDMKTGARDRNVGWRIDYFFVSPDLLPKVKDMEIYADYMGSDHCPVLIEIKD